MGWEVGSDFYQYDIKENIKVKEKFWDNMGSNLMFFRSGRNAINALISKISVDEKKILMPSYLCSTEIELWEKDDWEVEFYNVSEELSIDLLDLKNKISYFEPRVILIQEYFGFNTLPVSIKKEVRKLALNILLIEDISHNWIYKENFEYADYYVASLRKFFAIADGGILISSKRDINIVYDNYDINGMVDIAKKAFDTKAKYLKERQIDYKTEYRNYYSKLQLFYKENNGLYRISDFSKQILLYQDYKTITEFRMRNYLFIKDNIQTSSKYRNIFDDNIGMYIPLFFPLIFKTKEYRDACHKYLIKNSVFATKFWQIDDSIQAMKKISNTLYDRILLIPIDQRYNLDDMKKVITIINKWSDDVCAE